jgi:hypothetical protein
MISKELLHFYLTEKGSLVLEVSFLLMILLLVVLALFVLKAFTNRPFRRFRIVRLNITLGNVGTVELAPNTEDIQVAHRIWTELVTRKAALEIDPENDVIVDVYDSWYALFGRIRQLVGEVPAHLLREEESTRQIISIAINTLNMGLRPHLTRWQARFRNWYAQQEHDLRTRSPQEVQRDFPGYQELLADLRNLNKQLIQYAGELQKIVRGA